MLGTLRRGLLVFYYRRRLKRVGREFRIGIGSTIVQPERVEIGDHFFAGPRTYMSTPCEILIGDRVMFGPEVMIIGGDHDLRKSEVPLRFRPPPPNPPPIRIRDDAWIGARATILKGVTIGRGAVIGAQSLVTKSVPDFAIAIGSPAKVVKYRDDVEDPHASETRSDEAPRDDA